MRRLASALLTMLFSVGAAATTVSTEYTDMWWNPDESGWGANVVQQGDTLFVTLFVYDSQGNSTWFVAPSTTFQGGTRFSGPLYTTKGPYFADTSKFNPAAVSTLQIGDLSFEATSASNATLVYNQGGAVVTKLVTRQTWRIENLAGLYLGAREGNWVNCGAALNGRVDSFSQIGISQQGEQIQIRDAGTRYTCNYTGKVLPGRFTEIQGEGICDDNVRHILKATEVQVSQIGFSFRYLLQTVGSDCNFIGYLGGMRQIP